MKTKRSSLNMLTWLLLGGLLQSGALAAQDLSGTSEWGDEITQSTTASGLVSQVHVAAGDIVKRGTLLLELDPRNYKARLAAAESRREEKRLLHEEAQRELERSLELYDRTMLSEHELQLARIEAAKTDAALRSAEAELTKARLQRDYSRIKAPFDGRVVAIHVQPGEAVVNRLQAVPLVTLVGVINADTALNLPDFRAGERTFQLISQVAGRAGRGTRGGEVIIQTYAPEHYAIKAAAKHDYQAFYDEEIRQRKRLGYPPFRRLVRFLLRSSSPASAQTESRRLARVVQERITEKQAAADIVGPAPCFFRRLRGAYCWHFILRGAYPLDLIPERIPDRWVVDVDPVSLL